MKKWHWKAILGVWTVKFIAAMALVIAVDLTTSLALNRAGSYSHAQFVAAFKSTPHWVFLIAVEVIVDILSGYWLASIVRSRQMAHAGFMTALAMMVGVMLLPVNARAAHPLWYTLGAFVAISFIMVGAWWRVKTRGPVDSGKPTSESPGGAAPIASPFGD